MCKSGQFIAIFVAIAFMTINTNSFGQTPTPTDAHKVLDRFEGTWEKKITRHPTINDDRETKTTGRQVNKWVLDEKHMHESGTDSDGLKYISMFSYDENRKKFKVASFQNNGFSNELVAEWDAKSNCLTGTGSVGTGLTLTTKHMFTADDAFNVTIVVTDQDGNKHLDISVSAKRISK